MLQGRNRSGLLLAHKAFCWGAAENKGKMNKGIMGSGEKEENMYVCLLKSTILISVVDPDPVDPLLNGLLNPDS
jgi:hypothetical protein